MIFDFKKGFNDPETPINSEQPIVAISANIIDENSALHFAYSQSIVDAGALPIIVPVNCSESSILSLVQKIDGLLLSGGADIDARYFGEENIPNLTDLNATRDYYEFMLLRAAIDCGVPILGICRGCQLINIALGGSIYQDLPSMYSPDLLPHSILENRHKPVHEIEIVKESYLYDIIGSTHTAVNSRHHQAIKDIAPSLKVTARSKDGVVEAIEGYPTQKILAVQWHPENLATDGASKEMQRLFAHFVREAKLYQEAKQIHQLNPIVDSHCDTPMLYEQGGFNFSLRNSTSQVDVVKMQEGRLDATITVAYISQTTPKEEAFDKAISLLRRFKADVYQTRDKALLAGSVDDLLKAKLMGQRSVMLGLENGWAIGEELSNVDLLHAEGIRYITLCHNGSNQICDSAVGDKLHDGVSEFGVEVIRKMNQLGVTIDVSHSSHKSTIDVMELSSQPIIASHSSCKALCDHPRNLSDSAIEAIARAGGVVQICGYSGFLRLDGVATIIDIVEHIEHIVQLVGYDSVGVGSDFDGGGGVEGFNGANDFLNITVELLRRGYSKGNIAKIMGGNILRVLKSNSNI